MRETVSMPNLRKTAAGTSKTVLWGHAAKPPGYLSERTGNFRHPHFQGDTQNNPINCGNWSWTPMGPVFWEFVALYINHIAALLSWARKIQKVLCLFPLVFAAELLLHSTWWYQLRQHHLWGGCQVKIWIVTLSSYTFYIPYIGGCTLELPMVPKMPIKIPMPKLHPRSTELGSLGIRLQNQYFLESFSGHCEKSWEPLSWWTAIHSLKSYLLSTNYVPGTVPCPHGAYILVKTENKYSNMQINKITEYY